MQTNMNTDISLKRIISILVVIITLSLSSCGGAKIHSKKYIGTPSNTVWFEEDEYHSDFNSTLVKKDGKDYKILLLADIQVDKENKKGKKHAFGLIDKLVAATNPDFIVSLGDNTQGYHSDIMAKKLSNHIAKFNIPWAVVLGNHDSEGRRGRPWFGNHYEASKNSLFKYGPSNIHGVGNFTVQLKDENGDIIYSFVMFDSNTYREYEGGEGYDFIHRDQINWYEWQIKGISAAQYGEFNPEENKVVPSICFFHIPLLEFDDAAKAVKNGDINAANVIGENKEGVASAKLNSGLFDVMKRLKSTTHVYCGHDHINNMSVDWQGIKLSYGLKTGRTSYHDEGMQGGTLVTIKADKSNKVKSTAKVEMEHIYIINQVE